MKNRLRTTVSASAITVGILLSSQIARAADPMEQAYGPDWYVSVFGGASFARAHTAYAANEYDIRLRDGFSVGAAIGRHIGNGFRTESEISYAENANDKFRDGSVGSFDPDMNGETAAVLMLQNLWKDIRLSESVQPYIGGGLGTALLMSEESDDLNWDDSSIGLAGQLGAGVRIALSERISLDAGYRLRAVIDATFHSVDGDDNRAFSYHSHTAQLGLSYALGEGSRITHAGNGDPSDWYVSLFDGGVFPESTAFYYSGSATSIDHKTGFTVGGAIGTHLAPRLRTELEFSYVRSALDRHSDSAVDSNPASGHLEQGFLLANIWKDFNLGMLSPYIGGGIGLGAVHFDNGFLDDGQILSTDEMIDETGYGLAGQFGVGARMALSDSLSVDLGYRFKSIVDALLVGGNNLTNNSDVATRSHVVQLGLNYGFGEGANSAETSVVPDMRYVSLFGGGLLAEDTHANIDGQGYLVDFKTSFTAGAAVGANLTETLRGEVEVAFQTYDVDSVDEEGEPTTAPDGSVDSYFLMANLWRDFEIGGIRPYAGGGVGMALVDVDIDYGNNNHAVDGASLALAAQVGSGIRIPMTDALAIDVGYRFKAVAGVLTDPTTNDKYNSSTYYTHTGQVGVSWKF